MVQLELHKIDSLTILKMATISRDLISYRGPRYCHRIRTMVTECAHHDSHCGRVAPLCLYLNVYLSRVSI